ncbi:MAG: DUF1361 domain-containing protein [Saprospiraceae bacterium]
MKFINSFFYHRQQRDLFLILIATTFFDCLLVLTRLWRVDFNWSSIQSFEDIYHLRGSTSFLFLIFNLALAWIPYLVTLALPKVAKWKFTMSISFGLLIIWLLFFPNAPYIITDLIHIKSRPPIPLWFDALLIFSFAWTGLMVGFASLLTVQTFLVKHFSIKTVWILVSSALVLCGFGIYLGRFQRWHSWHIIEHPYALLSSIFETLTHPVANAGTLSIAVVLSGFLMLGYLTISIITRPIKTKN